MLYRIFSTQGIVLGMPPCTIRMARWLFVALMACALSEVAAADVITFSGAITQSTSVQTGPLLNNLSLNDIQDGDAFYGDAQFSRFHRCPWNLPVFNIIKQSSERCVSRRQTKESHFAGRTNGK